MRSIITGGLPGSVQINGEAVPINTDFRSWIDTWRLLDRKDVDINKQISAIIALLFSREGKSPTPYQIAMSEPEDALNAVFLFLARKTEHEPERPKTLRERKISKLRIFDWDYDSERVIADFQREYNLDITDPSTSIHWFRFMALFNGLSDSSRTIEAIQTRAADLEDKNLSKEEKKALREKKTILMLPARTNEEAVANSRLRGE